MAAERATILAMMSLLGMTGDSWAPWRTVARCLDGLPLSRDEHALFEQCTGRTRPLTEPPSEAWLVCGRRSGKSRFMSAPAIRAAAFVTHRLALGERAVVGLGAADREQARILLGYCTAPFTSEPALKGMVRPRSKWQALVDLVQRQTRWGIDLSNGSSIEVRTAHLGSIRGRSYSFVGCDEVSFWQSEDGSNPASAVLNAARPGLVNLNGQLLIGTTPYAKSGPTFDTFTKYYGIEDAPVLIWRAPTRSMNPTIPERAVLDALDRDEAAARSEWLAEFRDDISGLLLSERLAQVVIPGRATLPRLPEVDYLGFVDAASGAGADSMTLAIVHGEETEDGRILVVVDRIEEARPPFDPFAVARAHAAILAEYGCTSVTGDRFALGWVGAAFERLGIRYIPSELTRSEIYGEFLTLINGGLVELPEHPRLIQQLTALQRRPGSQGRDSIDHPVGGHDDVANAVAGACVLAHRLLTRSAAFVA